MNSDVYCNQINQRRGIEDGQENFHFVRPFLLFFALAISFTEEAAGSQNLFSNMQFSDIEPSGACTIDQTPQYIIDTDNECTCSNNTWSCSLSKGGIKSIATAFTLIKDNAEYKVIDSSGKAVFTSTDPSIVLQYAADVIFSTGGKIVLRSGDYIYLPNNYSKYKI